MNRPEAIEETAQVIAARGGQAIAMQVDHTRVDEVANLVQQIERHNDGRIDLLVNDFWGGDPFTVWGKPFWDQDLGVGLAMLNNAVTSHLITSHAVVPLMIRRGRGLVIEITDGVTDQWRDAIQKNKDFAVSETPYFIGRAVVALARDPQVGARTGKVLATWNLAREYGFRDVDGTQPHWGQYARQVFGVDMG